MQGKEIKEYKGIVMGEVLWSTNILKISFTCLKILWVAVQRSMKKN